MMDSVKNDSSSHSSSLQSRQDRSSQSALQKSLQIADTVIVSTDTRGFALARKLARRGWKTVVIELAGAAVSQEAEWADRMGPFLGWELESDEAVDHDGKPVRNHYASFWLPSGPVAFGGQEAKAGAAHLRIRYGVGESTGGGLFASKGLLESNWPDVMMKSVVASRLTRRESYLRQGFLRLPMEEPIKRKVSAEAVARSRRELATLMGVRILDAEHITALRQSDGRVDRIEFKSKSGEVFTERTRSLVWMLSEEESRRAEFVSSEVPLNRILQGGRVEPLMAWWRSRIAVRGLKNAQSTALARTPETPPHLVVVGSLERPWTHDNMLLMDLVEENDSMRVYDVWARIPYWSRADHVYRDEQRTLAQKLLEDRFAGCELMWVTPSPLALTDAAIRMPHILYAEGTVAAKEILKNICFAGPETWNGVGFQGLSPMEDGWIKTLEKLRVEWDPAALVKEGRLVKNEEART
jgi:hypothetical protein